MVNYNLIADIDVDDKQVDDLVRQSLGEQVAEGDMDGILEEQIASFQRGNILKGKVVGKAGDDVVIDVGLKSEGLINKSEFENYDGLVMVHDSVLTSLERVRADLCELHGQEVEAIPTDGVRTQADLERLAAKHGWTDEGGKVARRSKHLACFGGIAVDLKARIKSTEKPIDQAQLGAVCRRYFDWVKDDYGDGHVHADNRSGGLKV